MTNDAATPGAMLNQYRKLPVVITATQWFKHGDHAAVERVPLSDLECDFGWVKTLEGGHMVTPGDWIITGVKGEHYPCKPDIFAATYEPAYRAPAPPGPAATAAIQDAIPAEFQTVEPVSVPERAVVIDDARPGILVRGNQPEQQAFLCDCRTGHTLASGGFGSGKSWVGSRKFIALHRYNGCAGMMLVPTWGDLARVMAPYLILCDADGKPLPPPPPKPLDLSAKQRARAEPVRFSAYVQAQFPKAKGMARRAARLAVKVNNQWGRIAQNKRKPDGH
jgi:hypothetical protein